FNYQTTGSLYFWAAHLAGPRWGPFASWCCAWLETIGLVSGVGAQAYSASQSLQMIILLATGTNTGGGYYASRGVFLSMYIGFTLIWATLNTFALEVIAFFGIISMWWQVIGGLVVIIMLPLVAQQTQPASFVFTHFQTSPESTGISSKPYAIIMSVLLSNYCLYGYDSAAHLTEETKAQIIYDAFYGRYHNSAGAVVFLCIIWGSFFFCGLAVTTSAARVIYALSRDNGIPFSPIWRKLHPKSKVPVNAVWLCAAISIILGLPILKMDVVFTAILSISTVGWVGGYAVPIFARLVMEERNFKPWIGYTCSAFLLPTSYPIRLKTFNYAPVALAVCMGLVMLWWVLDARKWFKGPVRNIEVDSSSQHC
ncbi:unnamed protein product, partial [Linum tenue]